MRIALLILATVTLTCCKKNSGSFKDRLINKWEIRGTWGGVAGYFGYPPGNGFILEFKSDNSFVRYNKDTITSAGPYSLQPTPEKGQYMVTFYRDGSGNDNRTLILKGDKLEILYGQLGALYVKVN